MTQMSERTGSTQTLVCSKTRASHESQCRQYNEDFALNLFAAGINSPVLSGKTEDAAFRWV